VSNLRDALKASTKLLEDIRATTHFNQNLYGGSNKEWLASSKDQIALNKEILESTVKIEVVEWVKTDDKRSPGYDRPLDPPEYFDSIETAVMHIGALAILTDLTYRWRYKED